MALVDVKDHSYNRKISTSFHKYYFGRTEKPKILDLFNTNAGNMKFLWGSGISIDVGGAKVHKGFLLALQDFIMNHRQMLVKLTREEEDFFKKNFASVYKVYLENHKGKKFLNEIEEDKKRKLNKEED